MTFIQVDEYALAVLCWIAFAIVLFSKAVHWGGITGNRRFTRIARVVFILSATAFIPGSLIWTQAKRGRRPWSNLSSLWNRYFQETSGIVARSGTHPLGARSLVYVAPGLLGFEMGRDGTKPRLMGDFVVVTAGPDPCYNVEVLFVDEDRYRAVTAGKRNLSEKDVNSYQMLLHYQEIDAHSRGMEFRQPIIWSNTPDPQHGRYHAVITWRDGSLLEHLKIDRISNGGDNRPHTSMDEWVWSMDLQDRESGKMLVDCKDRGLGLGFITRTPKLQSCLPW
jgi:hypothetical protein